MTSLLILHLVQVMHDCRTIAGCLIAQFGVKLTNVFDTQVNTYTLTYSLQKHDEDDYALFTRGLCLILSFLFPECVKVADVMCFHSETGGFLPDRVSTLQEAVNLHLKVPSSQLLSLQMKSQLTKVYGTHKHRDILMATVLFYYNVLSVHALIRGMCVLSGGK